MFLERQKLNDLRKRIISCLEEDGFKQIQHYTLSPINYSAATFLIALIPKKKSELLKLDQVKKTLEEEFAGITFISIDMEFLKLQVDLTKEYKKLNQRVQPEKQVVLNPA